MRSSHQRNSLTVCVIEQNRLAAEYLIHLLRKDPAICPLLLEDCSKYPSRFIHPVFVLDNWGLSLPLIVCLRRLASRYPKAGYVVLDKEPSNEEIVRMLSFGVHGFLRHRDVAQTLIQAVRAVSEGHIWASPGVLQIYVQFTSASNRSRPPAAEGTTERETQVIELVKRRFSNKEIATILKVQESTVKFHLSNVFSKLQLTSRHDLVRKYEILGKGAEILA